MDFLIDPYRTPVLKVTSLCYPITFQDHMTVTTTLGTVTFWGWPIDKMTLAADLVSGTLQSILLKYTSPYEAITAAADFVSGELHQILISYSGQYEAITASCDFVSGELKVVLISYNRWDPNQEKFTISGDLVSGTLS